MRYCEGRKCAGDLQKARLQSWPTKIAACCVMRNDAKVSPMRIPRYFARSPTSIFSEMRFIALLPPPPVAP